MRDRREKSPIEGLLVLVLFGIFAVCILMVLLTGAGAYKRLADQGQASYGTRTVPHYLATKVRQADATDVISVGSLGDVETLEITEMIGNVEYVTRIYCYDGYVRELFSGAEGTFGPGEGEPIMEAQSMRFSLAENCLTVEIIQKNGEITCQKLTLRSAGGGS